MLNKRSRKIFRYIHLVLGLIAGLVVFVEAVTGAIWVFNEEIKSLYESEIQIERQDKPLLKPTEIKAIAQKEIPGKPIHGVLFSTDPAPVEVIFYQAEPEYYQSLFINPYSGDVIKRVNHEEGFFHFILEGHLHLWLPPEIGTPIVTYGTLMFLISIITGVVLWWPKNKKGRRQRFKFDWKTTTRWRRKNFDLHTVLGFYLSALALIFVVTGLVMGLSWFNYVFYNSIGGDKKVEFIIPANNSAVKTAASLDSPIDELPEVLAKNYPDAQDYEIHFPHSDSSSIYVEVSYLDEVYYDADYVFFDQNTLEEVDTESIYGKYENASAQDHLMRAGYDLHVGAILGLPTKVLAFLASLLIASLPITGVIIYVGRKKKKKKKAKEYSIA